MGTSQQRLPLAQCPSRHEQAHMAFHKHTRTIFRKQRMILRLLTTRPWFTPCRRPYRLGHCEYCLHGT